MGNDQLRDEFEKVGISVYGGDEDNHKYMDTESFRKIILDNEVLAVVN